MTNLETQTNIELSPMDQERQSICQESINLRDELDSECLVTNTIEGNDNWNSNVVLDIYNSRLNLENVT